MRSPRWVRPHTIVIVNYDEEVDFKKESKNTILSHVKVQGKHHTRVEDVDVSNRDGIVVTIDVSDVEEEYIPFAQWDGKTGWTAHSEGDHLIYEGIEYSIVGFTIINPLKRIEFVELLCQRM